VGLPGRGKTFLCNKLCCYLNWLGHATRHFNVGAYRRCQRSNDEVQDAGFFDHANEAGVEARNRALHAALDDLVAYLRSDSGQVAVFDATNTTESRRALLRSKFHGVWQYLFIETICSDPLVLEHNYRNKMKYRRAVTDFLARIAKYEEVYQPIVDRNLHYIKLIDMVTGRGHMDVNRISGYLPGKTTFFLMQVCKAGIQSTRRIWLTRHGESQYNQKALIGGNSSLSERGERYSRCLPEALIARLPQDEPVSVAVWTSTLKRTIETARFLPFPKLRWKALDEINAGSCDGMTYEGIAERYPHEYDARKKDKLRYRYPAGESYMDVIQRVEPVVIELERERECVVVAVLRAVYGYFMNVPPEDIPRLDMPLHTLIELTPMPDGTMSEARFPVDINNAPEVMRGAVGAGSSGGGAVDHAPGLSPQSSLNSTASCQHDAGRLLGAGAGAGAAGVALSAQVAGPGAAAVLAVV
ncbi:6-phosphofructo-2-kinase/fructose-2,6-bisphosphatase, partial [Tetrabaena socialis]